MCRRFDSSLVSRPCSEGIPRTTGGLFPLFERRERDSPFGGMDRVVLLVAHPSQRRVARHQEVT